MPFIISGSLFDLLYGLGTYDLPFIIYGSLFDLLYGLGTYDLPFINCGYGSWFTLLFLLNPLKPPVFDAGTSNGVYKSFWLAGSGPVYDWFFMSTFLSGIPSWFLLKFYGLCDLKPYASSSYGELLERRFLSGETIMWAAT